MSREDPRHFGTDGIRGVFGEPPLDEATVRRLGLALGSSLREAGDGRARVVFGGDTRFSTPELCAWLAAGLHAAGTELTFLGTVPTPAVAFATRNASKTTDGAVAGVAVSASHNPYPDNGIKVLDADGYKWGPRREAALEALLEATPDVAGTASDNTVSDNTAPDLVVDRARVDAYLAALRRSVLRSGVPEDVLDGFAVALDTGNGAASPYARELFESLGARVCIRHDTPDGRNINAGCGSTHPEVVAEMVEHCDSQVGFSFDGDADRVILADERGTIRDGDVVLYLWARALQEAGELPGNRVVATSMSNLGLEVALRRAGITLERCDVGDRQVMLRMRELGAVLGGEQSGHIIHLGLGTTGDGLLTALQMAALVARSGRPLSELAAGFERFPQLIRNVRVREKPSLEGMPKVARAWRAVEEKLDGEGRLVLRYSGTEPLARIMIEGRDKATIEALADELAEVIADEIGA